MTVEGADPAVTLGGDGDKSGGTPTPAGGDPTGGSGGDPKQQGADFLAGLSPENREWFSKKGWKSLDDAFTSHRNADKLISSGKHKEGNTGSPEVPAAPQLYEFKLPDGFDAEKAGYDKTFAEAFKSMAHKAKLTGAQAQALHDAYLEWYSGQFTEFQKQSGEQLRTAMASAHAELTKAWGDPETPGFKRNLELAKRTLRLADPGLKDAFMQAGFIVKGPDGKETVTNAAVFKALAKLGAQVYAEDELFSEQAQAENPFDPKKPNLQRQGELIKSDPELAKTLIRAAGVEQWFQHFLNSPKK